MNQKNDRIWFDQVIITGDASNAPLVFNGPSSFDLDIDENIAMYPNPTNDILNIEILRGAFDVINIYNTLGVLVDQLDGSLKNTLSM